MEQKIEIESFNFKGFQVLDGTLPELIILSDKEIEYKWKINARVTNEDESVIERKYQGSKSILKSKIIGVEAMWDEDKACYTVSVFSGDFSMTIAYKTFPEALKVKGQIMNWLIS